MEPQFVAEPLDQNPGSTCGKLYPSHTFPREVAGEDIAGIHLGSNTCVRRTCPVVELHDMPKRPFSGLT